MKTQAIYLPNGMVSHVFFTSIAQNDNGVINISGIEEELERVLNDCMLPGNFFLLSMEMKYILHLRY